MNTIQIRWSVASGWEIPDPETAERAGLILVFADHRHFQDPACYAELKRMFPNAHIVGCSSAGSVLGTSISDGDVVATAVSLDHGRVEIAVEDIGESSDIETLAAGIMRRLDHGDLKHVFALSDGLKINGSLLAQGFQEAGGHRISVTGGLAGDGTRFEETWVMADGPAQQGCIAAIGFYGDLTVKTGCYAGWEEFGAERLVTRSRGNVVYAIDDQPALALYKKYLGAQASELPASGLRFPLSVRARKDTAPIIRTLLAVDEPAQSLTFAGDVPEGNYCRLMKTNIGDLIESAETAARFAHPGRSFGGGLCLVVSCVGRRLVLGQLSEEELEAVRDKLESVAAITGFYSYGELAPFGERLQCQLHNQTMTLTTLFE